MIVRNTDVEPQISGLVVRTQSTGGVILEIDDLESVGVESADLGKQLPRVCDGLLLELFAKYLIAQRLEKNKYGSSCPCRRGAMDR